MDKAYDLKALGAILKSKGLDLAEEAIEIIYDSSIEWFKQSAQLSKTPIADLIMLYNKAKSAVVGEQNAEAIQKGLGTSSKIRVRF